MPPASRLRAAARACSLGLGARDYALLPVSQLWPHRSAHLGEVERDSARPADGTGCSLEPSLLWRLRAPSLQLTVAVAELVSCIPLRKLGDGLFLQCCRAVAARYPQITFENMIVDNTTMQVVRLPCCAAPALGSRGCLCSRCWPSPPCPTAGVPAPAVRCHGDAQSLRQHRQQRLRRVGRGPRPRSWGQLRPRVCRV